MRQKKSKSVLPTLIKGFDQLLCSWMEIEFAQKGVFINCTTTFNEKHEPRHSFTIVHGGVIMPDKRRFKDYAMMRDKAFKAALKWASPKVYKSRYGKILKEKRHQQLSKKSRLISKKLKVNSNT